MKIKFNENVELLFIQNADGNILISNKDGNLIATLSISEVELDNGEKSKEEFYLNFGIKDKSNCVAHDWASCTFKK